MKLISFGKFKVISSDTIECGGGPDDSSFINILLNDAIILSSTDKLPTPLRDDEVYYAIPQYDETIVGVNRFKLSLHKNGDPIIFTGNGSEIGEIQTVINFTGWLSSRDVEHSRFKNVKIFRFQNYDTVQLYSSGRLPFPLMADQTYSIVSADEVSFRLSETTNGLPLSFTTAGSGIYFFRFSLVGFNPVELLGATYTPLVTPVRNYHVTDLRTRINNELIRRGKPTYTFTDPTLTATITKVTTTHINQLRAAAQQIAPYITLVVTDPVLVATVTKIKAVHLQEIDNYVTAREAQVKVTCTWNYAASTSVTLPACASVDPVCAWGVGGGGGGGYGGTGGAGGPGGSGGCGGRGGESGYSIGGCGGRGGAGRRGWFSLWPAGFQPPGVAGSGGGGGGGGAGSQPRQGYGGYGGGAGTAGGGGAGGGAGAAGTVGSGNIYSWPASPCVLPVGAQSLYVNIGGGGGSGSNGGHTYVCCISGAILLTAAGGTTGSTGSPPFYPGTPGINGANQTSVPPSPGAVGSGYNGVIGGDAGFAGFSTGTNPTCAWGGDGGTGGCDAGGGWGAGGGGGGGGAAYNYSYNQYGSWYTRCAWGGTGGGGKGGGGGGGAGGVLSADGGIVTGGGGGVALSGGYFGGNGSPGTTFQCNAWPPDKDATGYGGAGGLGTNPDGGHGGYGGCVSQLVGNTCIGLSGGGMGSPSPEYPSSGAGGDGGGGGGPRTGRSDGAGGAPATGGNCGWFGYGCSGGGGAGGAGGYGGYGGAGGGGGTGASAPPGGPGGWGGCGSWSYACRIGGNQSFYAYTNGLYGTYCTYYNYTIGGTGEGGEGGGGGSGGSAGGNGSSGYVRLTFSVWV
jgi:hypothetical protein